MEKFDITIIGAGVAGLAIASELASEDTSIILLEKNSKFGQETSSRNSEVIHGGIYYQEKSLKAELCVRGRILLYETCRKYDIPHKNCGKLIIAINEEEIKSLEELKAKAEKNGVFDLVFLDRKEIKKREPHIDAICALYSPSTGIIDSHSLMYHFLCRAEARGLLINYNAPLTSLEKIKDRWLCTGKDSDGSSFTFSSGVVINAAGLGASQVAEMAGMKDYKIHYCKGEYFSVIKGKNRLIKGLVYPSPARDMVSLGIHTVIDLGGGLKLGPSAFYVDEIDYSVNPDNRDLFYENCKAFLPFLEKEDLVPDMSGIRPKLQGPGEPVRDFVIKTERGDFEGLINLIGIESPGLTSCMAIARYVSEIYKNITE